jgi:hypothetical protein
MRQSTFLPGGFAESSDLQQSESGRFSHSDPGHDFGFAALVEGGGSRGYFAGAEDFATAGRRAGFNQRRAEARGASQVNPTALASYGLSLEDVRTALAQANVDQAKGVIDGVRQSYTIGANDQLFGSDQYKPIVIAYHNGAPVGSAMWRTSSMARKIRGWPRG